MRWIGARVDGLPEATVEDVALQILANPPPDLRQPATEHMYLAGQAVKDRKDLESRLRAEIKAVNDIGERARFTAHWRLWLALAVCVASFVWIVLNADVIFGTPTRDGWIVLGIFGFLGLLSAAFVIRDLRLVIPVWSAERSTLRALDEATYKHVGEVLRKVVNDSWDEETRWGLEFDSQSAPTMVGVAIDNAVSSTTYVELSTFVKEHSTSAIGVAGPRGIGKSTLMEQLRLDPRLNCIGVRIPAPKRYEPAALILS